MEEDNYPPFNFKDQKSDELTSFEVDVPKLLAAKLGGKPEFTITEWSGASWRVSTSVNMT